MAARLSYRGIFVYVMLAVLPESAFAAETTPIIEKFRAYLIYEDTGKLSKNIEERQDQIVANDENGTSVQVLKHVAANRIQFCWNKPD